MGQKKEKVKKESPKKLEKNNLTAEDLSKRLYIRMNKKITEFIEIQEMHPLITRVILPRQSSRFCFVEFDSKKDTDKARRELLKKYKGIIIKPATMKERTEKIQPFNIIVAA